MGTTLTGKRVQNTYDALLKLSDNQNLTGTAKIVGDGYGNDSPIYLSTSQIGIGITPSYQFHTSGNAKIGGNLIISGNLTVNGTLTYLNVEDLAVEDPLIKLAKDNTANTLDIGLFGKYVATGTKYKGLFNDASDDKFKLFIGTSTEPTTTVDTTASGYSVGTLVANLEGDVTGTVSSLSNHTTSNLTEGTNLYFTTTKARASFTEGTGVTITDGEIAIGQAVNTDSNVTFGNISGSAISGTTGAFSGDLTLTNDGPRLIFESTNNASGGRINITGLDQDTDDLLRIQDNATDRFSIKRDGKATFTNLVTGIAPTSDLNFATKKYVDDNIPTITTPTLSAVLGTGNTSGANNIIMADDQKVFLGTDSDLEIYHDGTDGYIDNINGALVIQNNGNDKSIIFKTDNGIGGITQYFKIDGNINRNVISVTTQLNDNVPMIFGDGAGRPSIKYDSTASQLFISGESKFLNDLFVTGNLTAKHGIFQVPSTVNLANQPAEPLFVSNNGEGVDGRVFITVKNDIINTASALGAGIKMTAGAVTSGTASYFDSLIFVQSKQPGNNTIHSAPTNIQFFVDNDGTAAGAGTSYDDFGNIALQLYANRTAQFYNTVTSTGFIGGTISGTTGAFSSRIFIGGGSDSGSQLNLWADSNGNTFLAGYNFAIYTGNNNSRTQSFIIDHLKAATFAGSVTATGFSGPLTGNVTGDLTGNVTGGNITTDTKFVQTGTSTNLLAGSVKIDATNPTLTLQASVDPGNANIQFLDSSSNVEQSISANSNNLLITTRAGEIKFNTAQTLAATLDTSQNLAVVGSVTASSFIGPLTGTASNAALLDNIDSSEFLRSNTADTATGQIFFDASFEAHPIMLSGSQNFDNIDRSGFYNLYNTNSGSTSSPGFDYGTMIAIGNDKGAAGFGFQLAHERLGTGMYVRGMNDTASAWSAWAEVWTSTTDGAGSGLDADLLDGQQGSYYAPATGGSYVAKAGDTMTGSLVINGTESDISFEEGSMNFKDANEYIRITKANASAQLGLFRAGDGGMYIGGSSSGFRLYTASFAPKMTVDQNGNASFSGTVSGTNFIDSNNTNYYLDPSSTGISLNVAGRIQTSSTGVAAAPSLEINCPTSSTFIHTAEVLTANMTAGQANIFVIGKIGNTKNSGYIGYNWASNASNNNYITIGHWGENHIFRVYGDVVTSTVGIRSAIDVRGTIFYDTNSTNYYLDPSTTGTSLNAAGFIQGSNINTYIKYLGAGVSYDINRTTKVSSGIATYSAYSTGTNRPHTYDFAAQFVGNNRGFELSAAWHSQTALSIRTLRDCCQNWSAWYPIAIHGLNTSNANLYAGRYYDANDTTYYGDFASTSIINGLTTAGNIESSGRVRINGGNGVGDPGSQLVLWSDSSGYCYMAGYTLRFMTGGNNARTNRFTMNQSGTFTANGAVQSPIYYSSSDNTYYLYPNSTSVLYGMDIRNAATIKSNTSSRVLYLKQQSSGNGNIIQFQDQSANNCWELVGRNNGFYIYNNMNSVGYVMESRADNGYVAILKSGTDASYHLDVGGTIRATSDVIAFSDRRVKENIVTIDNALEKVTKLRGVSYTRKDIDDKSTKIGVIAQEVLEVLPEVVTKDNDDKYSVAYGNMAGVFIEAIKELKTEIDSLKQEIKILKNN